LHIFLSLAWHVLGTAFKLLFLKNIKLFYNVSIGLEIPITSTKRCRFSLMDIASFLAGLRL